MSRFIDFCPARTSNGMSTHTYIHTCAHIRRHMYICIYTNRTAHAENLETTRRCPATMFDISFNFLWIPFMFNGIDGKRIYLYLTGILSGFISRAKCKQSFPFELIQNFTALNLAEACYHLLSSWNSGFFPYSITLCVGVYWFCAMSKLCKTANLLYMYNYVYPSLVKYLDFLYI